MLPNNIVIFDGSCNFCNAGVRFIIERDPNKVFHFASIQSEVGAELARQYGFDPERMGTMLLIRDGKILCDSDAPLTIAGDLSGPWRNFKTALWCPRFLRDAVYRFIARRRHQWMGDSAECALPTPDQRDRFLD